MIWKAALISVYSGVSSTGAHMAVSTTTNRNDAAVPFKLRRMTHRTTHPDFPPRHPFEKHRASEEAVFTEMAKMSPVHMGRKSSTYDEDLLEKSSEAGREQLQNATLHYFLACKISVEEAGDIILEEEQTFFEEEAAINADNLVRGRKNTAPEKSTPIRSTSAMSVAWGLWSRVWRGARAMSFCCSRPATSK